MGSLKSPCATSNRGFVYSADADGDADADADSDFVYSADSV